MRRPRDPVGVPANLDTRLITLAGMDRLTIQQAAQTTGWSARMLRYVERIGLVEAERSGAGYRLYGPAQLQRLRTLRELLERYGVELSDVGFAARLRDDDELRAAVDEWLDAEPRRPDDVAASEWLRWEQEKHEALLAPAAVSTEPLSAPQPDAPARPATGSAHQPRRQTPPHVKETA